ncbi:MAG TPA: SpoIVB peptidase S55 domain-containing protein [Limnochordia bacterium]|nr:SpoIVB peptidase S55 domain-containing protein [Limnochordia bacterium]
MAIGAALAAVLSGMPALAGSAPVAASSPTSTPTPILPLADVRPGMHGIGKSVFKGNRIETFDVDVLGVLANQGPAGDLILVRVSGPAIDPYGGIAEGMSGSPVYVDGKLLGAIGYGFDMSDHHIGFVTPIEQMLRVMNLPTEPAPSEQGSTAPPGSERLATPIIASGFSPRSRARLAAALAPLGPISIAAGALQPAASAAPSSQASAPLEPGAAIGVQLLRGDADLTAIGTLTYRAGDRFVAFGHPFTNQGGVGFFATSAYVFDTVPSVSVPFKLAAPLATVGAVTQDRGAAVAGRFGAPPASLPISVDLTDRDTKHTSHFSVQMVRDPALSQTLGAVAALDAFDRGLDRIGAGTAKVTITFTGEGLPQPVVRKNTYYSDFDISATALSDYLTGLDLLYNNAFQDPKLTGIAIAAEVERAQHTASIDAAHASTTEVAPGSTITVHVTLHAYRGAKFERSVAIDIPADTPPGDLTLTVRGGSPGLSLGLPDTATNDAYTPNPAITLPKAKASAAESNAQSLANLIDDYVNDEHNNDLVVEFFPPGSGYLDAGPDVGAGLPIDPVSLDPSGEADPRAGKTAAADAGDGAGAAAADDSESIKSSVATDYVIRGTTDVTVHVVPLPYSPVEPALPHPTATPPTATRPALSHPNAARAAWYPPATN